MGSNTTATLPLHPDFDMLRDLTITGWGSDVAFEAALIAKCPNLECLEWEVDRRDMDARLIPHVQGFIQGLVRGKWANLKSLSIRHQFVQDAVFEEIIQALDNRMLEELDVSKTQFGEQAFGALRHYFSTLRIVNIRNCPNLNSANVMELLTLCPHLQSLAVDRIYAQYLDTDQIWPCNKTLQSLSIEFELDREPNTSESSGATERTPEELNGVVFACLGQLRELESLTVGYPKPVRYGQAYDQASIPLEIQLTKGLGALAGLKRLNSFSMGDLTGSLGPKEVDWMIGNWPQLGVLEGLSKTTKKIPRQRVAKRNGIKVK
ncbi:hypothetical protein BGX20_006585 [Mortierella sp. AD010]|nr:hypothetical protein BGX20_006585 [Mortierella sp. AD010]